MLKKTATSIEANDTGQEQEKQFGPKMDIRKQGSWLKQILST